MTVCIGVLCDGGRTFLFAADKMLSLGQVSSDSASKGWQVNHRWVALNAGNDIAQAEPVLWRVGKRLGPYEEEAQASDVETAFSEIYRDELRQEAERRVLGRYGLTMARFLAEGRTTFGDYKFAELCQDVESVELGCQFLVCGFDKGPLGEPHIFTVENPGITRTYSRIGYWAIGSGAMSALGSLMFHQYSAGESNPVAAYYIAQAKFMAESALGVGRETAFYFMQRGAQVAGIPSPHIQAIREIWEKEGRPRRPENLHSKMKGIINLADPAADRPK